MQSRKYRLIVAIAVIVMLSLLLFSACNFDFLGSNDQSAGPPAESQILAPANQTVTLVGSPVQILSAHADTNLDKVELLVNGNVQRTDPVNALRVTQSWTPLTAGDYQLQVNGYDADGNQVSTTETIVITVRPNEVAEAIEPATPSSVSGAAATPKQEEQTASEILEDAFQPQNVCNFGEPNAPTLNSVQLDGIGEIKAQLGNSLTLPAEAGQSLALTWDVGNANLINLTFTGPTGDSRPYESVNPVETVTYQADEAGLYTISLNARNEQCSSTVEWQINVGAIQIAVRATATPMAAAAMAPTPLPTPTPTAFYPPPPAAPGVPIGPTQEELPELRPPVCDAADYLDVYVPSTSDRIVITEPDDLAAKTVGGALVHRAWRIQNTGTCTWGPGYELAFYGGRSMGSGGVAFESFFPNEPDRRNIVQSDNRLVAPEGQPNQVAVLEVILNAPVTPGIHQSYWRMRNPQGVYFGPIFGVTLEVVRECRFGIYGAPVINYFEILGVGNVFRPENPIEVIAQLGEPVTVDWSIINIDNYDIIVRGPTGSSANLSTNSNTDRNTFIPNQVGQYKLTLFADNGPCTANADVFVNVVPNENDTSSFQLEIQRANTNQLVANWNHLDPTIDQVYLYAQRYERQKGRQCLFGYNNWWEAVSPIVCEENQWSEWEAMPGQPLPTEILAVSNSQSAQVSSNTPILGGQSAAVVGSETVNQGARVSVAGAQIGATAQGGATIANVEWGLCPENFDSAANSAVDVGVRYQLLAQLNGSNAVPAWSNIVDVRCGGAVSGGAAGAGAASGAPRPNPDFNPD